MENAKKNDCKTMYKVIIKTVIPQFIWNKKTTTGDWFI